MRGQPTLCWSVNSVINNQCLRNQWITRLLRVHGATQVQRRTCTHGTAWDHGRLRQLGVGWLWRHGDRLEARHWLDRHLLETRSMFPTRTRAAVHVRTVCAFAESSHLRVISQSITSDTMRSSRVEATRCCHVSPTRARARARPRPYTRELADVLTVVLPSIQNMIFFCSVCLLTRWFSPLLSPSLFPLSSSLSLLSFWVHVLPFILLLCWSTPACDTFPPRPLLVPTSLPT